MVGLDAGGGVGLQHVLRRGGQMAVEHLVAEQLQLFENVLIAVDHAIGVHHLAQSPHPRMAGEGRQILGVHLTACMLKGGGGHAGGNLDIVVNGHLGRAVQHKLNAGGARHIGNLMGVCDERRHTGPQLLRTVDLRQRHGGLHMAVGVDKPGGDVAVLQIHGVGAVIRSDACNPAVCDGDVRPQNCSREYLDDSPIFEHQIRRTVAARRLNQYLPVHTAPTFVCDGWIHWFAFIGH